MRCGLKPTEPKNAGPNTTALIFQGSEPSMPLAAERRAASLIAAILGQMVLILLAVNVALHMMPPSALADGRSGPLQIVAFGDSLTAGLGLAPSEAFPEVLQRNLKAAGHNVVIQNAGVSGDTTGGGLARLDWSVPDGTDLVILELGANDMLTGQSADRARANLDAIIVRLKARGIDILLAGMRASRSLGADYADAFDRIFPELAQKHDLALYPFFLEGVALDAALNQPDGIHPTAEGVRRIASGIKPAVEAVIAKVQARRGRAQSK